LDENGALHVNAVTRYTGLQQDDIHGMIHHLSKEKVKEYLHGQFDFSTYDISRFQYDEEKALLPGITETLEISVSNYATVTGKRLFIVPNIMTRNNSKLAPDEDRQFDLVFQAEYLDTDTVVITLPEGYLPEAMPKDVSVRNQFGSYQCAVQLTGNTLCYTRRLERYAGRFPAKDYRELETFYETMYRSDRNRIVLVKKETTKGF